MKLHKSGAEILIPDDTGVEAALARTTHLAIGGHQDDAEIMASHGVIECMASDSKWFTSVVLSDGSGSARTGEFADKTDAEMADIRKEEQREAGRMGKYSAVVQLGYTSTELKTPGNADPLEDLVVLLDAAEPEVVYVHNPADKHATHVAAMFAAIGAIRRLPKVQRPEKVYGCEVWRGLDWMPDERKVVLDTSGHEEFVESLVSVYRSQIAGGKTYDAATVGRAVANATYYASHSVDTMTSAVYAVDLSPLIHDDSQDVTAFTLGLIDEFRAAVREQLSVQ